MRIGTLKPLAYFVLLYILLTQVINPEDESVWYEFYSININWEKTSGIKYSSLLELYNHIVAKIVSDIVITDSDDVESHRDLII